MCRGLHSCTPPYKSPHPLMCRIGCDNVDGRRDGHRVDQTRDRATWGGVVSYRAPSLDRTKLARSFERDADAAESLRTTSASGAIP